jgi:NAD(P)-dependent dehydrogenase (short-subunit alcohol dehydrogenase family)
MRTIDLGGKVAIVTGGARGIGRAYSLGLAEAGAAVAVVDLLEDEGRQTASDIVAAGGRAMFLRVDVADVGSTEAMAASVIGELGGIDVLINNAGAFANLQGGSLLDIAVDRWDRTIAVNVKGPWLCTRAVVPAMRERGGGSIVNMVSIAAFGLPWLLDYSTSKAALIGLTKNAALELAADDIRVNAIAPGGTATEGAASHVGGDLDAVRRTAMSTRPLQRSLEPEDLVGTMLYLVSDASSLMTGQTLVVDGGRFLLG